MDARPRLFGMALMAMAVLFPTADALARGGYRTANFVVTAPTPALAREIGETAEKLRSDLSIEWIGQAMPNWIKPCPIVAKVSPGLGAGGATTFIFDRGEVFGWEMEIQGSRERVLDSVLPHEITHTVFASYFRQPLPRWADEGACTTVEHPSEINKQERLLIQFLKTNKGIPFSQMFAMKEYPAEVLPLYAQGHSLTQFLFERRGKPAFLDFLADGMSDENWRRAVAKHYGHDNLYALQEDWLGWVKSGRPRLAMDTSPVANLANSPAPTIIRGQGPSPVAPRSVTVVPSQGGSPSVYSVTAATTPKLSPPPPSRAYDASRGNGAIWR